MLRYLINEMYNVGNQKMSDIKWMWWLFSLWIMMIIDTETYMVMWCAMSMTYMVMVMWCAMGILYIEEIDIMSNLWEFIHKREYS